MIEREKFAWGVRRTLKPFHAPNRHAAIELTADVQKTPAGRVPEVGIRIVNHREPLSMADTFILIQALQAFRAEIDSEAKKMIERAKINVANGRAKPTKAVKKKK